MDKMFTPPRNYVKSNSNLVCRLDMPLEYTYLYFVEIKWEMTSLLRHLTFSLCEQKLETNGCTDFTEFFIKQYISIQFHSFIHSFIHK